MRWLLHSNLTPAVADAMRRHEQTVQTPEEVGLTPDASPQEIFALARSKQLEILTADANLASAPFEQRIVFPRIIVYLQLEGEDVEQDDAIDRLFQRYKRLNPKHLYTLTASRVKVRQLPTTP
jgi:predicted nuclease of predicted toxin-antitoxin system